MARITGISANLAAFLDALAACEGTAGIGDDGYNLVVTGQDGRIELFADYRNHPFATGRTPKQIRPGLRSTAAGRYQQMVKDWPHYRAQLDLQDFGPIAQDRLAIQHIRECRALPDIEAGHIAAAIDKVRHIWASLPGAGYGQPERSLAKVLADYLKSGGTLA